MAKGKFFSKVGRKRQIKIQPSEASSRAAVQRPAKAARALYQDDETVYKPTLGSVFHGHTKPICKIFYMHLSANG